MTSCTSPLPIPNLSPPRIAFFTDTFDEANGVSTLSRQFAQFAQAQNIPLLIVHGSNETKLSQKGSLSILKLKRGSTSFALDKGLYCDPLLIRHKRLILDQFRTFTPDLVHVTGPGDVGFLGLLVSHLTSVPRVASWHTNLHQYLSRRLHRLLNLTPPRWRNDAAHGLETLSLRGLLRFYRAFHFVLAPNQLMVDLLQTRTGRPAFLMAHGVDSREYTPALAGERNRPFCIGYVGRLTAEKNVRDLVTVKQSLILAGERNFRFLIVGEGGQQDWLRKHLANSEVTGVLRGDELAAAYRSMDVFVFPSRTDTFGLVLLEAMASGLPVIATEATGANVGIEGGVSGFLTDDFGPPLLRLMHDQRLRSHMGKAARDFACGNSWYQVFDKLYGTYARALALVQGRQSDQLDSTT